MTKKLAMKDRRKRHYSIRNEIVRAAGFKDYTEYLRSDSWGRLREKKLRLNPRCFVCGGEATQIHHGEYKWRNLLGGCVNSLFSVCRSCHEKCEFADDGEKLSPREATRRLKKMRRRKKKGKEVPA